MELNSIIILVVGITICLYLFSAGFQKMNESFLVGFAIVMLSLFGIIYLICYYVFHHTPGELLTMFHNCLKTDSCA